jgi:hypothetical protein
MQGLTCVRPEGRAGDDQPLLTVERDAVDLVAIALAGQISRHFAAVADVGIERTVVVIDGEGEIVVGRGIVRFAGYDNLSLM